MLTEENVVDDPAPNPKGFLISVGNEGLSHIKQRMSEKGESGTKAATALFQDGLAALAKIAAYDALTREKDAEIARLRADLGNLRTGLEKFRKQASDAENGLKVALNDLKHERDLHAGQAQQQLQSQNHCLNQLNEAKRQRDAAVDLIVKNGFETRTSIRRRLQITD